MGPYYSLHLKNNLSLQFVIEKKANTVNLKPLNDTRSPILFLSISTFLFTLNRVYFPSIIYFSFIT